MTDGAGAVDRAHLERLGSRFGAGFLTQLIDLFIGQGADRIGDAERALARGDLIAVAAAAHALKSSAGNLGAHGLMACAAALEQAGRNGGDAASLAPRVATLRAAYEEAAAQLGALRATSGGAGSAGSAGATA